MIYTAGPRSPFVTPLRYASMSASELYAQTLQAAQRYFKLRTAELLITGSAFGPEHSQTALIATGQNIANFQVQQSCASGLQALISGVRIKQKNTLIGGIDYLCDLTQDSIHRNEVSKKNPPKALQTKWAQNHHGDLDIIRRNESSRREQDHYASQSHQRAYSAKLLPHSVYLPPDYQQSITADSNIIPPPSQMQVKAAQPFFPHSPFTPSNCCPLSEGAAVGILSDRAMGDYACKIIAFRQEQTEFVLTADAIGIYKTLKQQQLKLSEIAVFEIHESSAAAIITTRNSLNSDSFCQQHFQSQALGLIELEQINPYGGAIAFGHPPGASGLRMLNHLAAFLSINNGRYGALSLTSVTGLNTTILVESLK